MDYKVLLGISGVSYRENAKAKRIGAQLEVLVLLAVFAVFVQLLLFYSGSSINTYWVSVMVWLIFTAELGVNLYNVTDRRRYLRENWLNVLIVVFACPVIEWSSDWVVIVRSLRLLMFLRFFAHFYRDAEAVLKRHRFGQILVGAAFLIVGAGGAFAYLEDRTLSDGIWYAIVTVTTVGYGDVVPATENGRLFGVFLIIFGVVLFSLVTANIAAFLIGSGQRQQEHEILNYVRLMEERLEKQTLENQEHVEKIIKHMTKEIRELKEQLEEAKTN
jgi:voltage-gated potassium channel